MASVALKRIVQAGASDEYIFPTNKNQEKVLGYEITD